jgi:uncharacterized glyoxalase superfamily protein PhnB
VTSRIPLSLIVTGVTYRHPRLLARIVATMDELSSGRAELGIEAAWNERWHCGLGVPFPPTAERFERLVGLKARMEPASMSVALAVRDVAEASRFYQRFGFEQEHALPNESGGLAFSLLIRDGAQLLLGPLEETHYGGPERSELIQAGPRGLGVTLILQVDDLDDAYRLAREAGLSILVEPVDEYYGDRVFFFLDPFGYEWKVSQPIEATG